MIAVRMKVRIAKKTPRLFGLVWPDTVSPTKQVRYKALQLLGAKYSSSRSAGNGSRFGFVGNERNLKKISTPEIPMATNEITANIFMIKE